MTKSTITREQLEEWVAQFDEDGGCDATDRQLEALIRQSLAAMDSEPVAEVLSNRSGNDTSTIDRALPVGTQLYRHAQPAPVVPAVSDDIGEIRVGRLPTMNQDDYPGLGDWWVQLRIGEDSDEVLARVYGATPQEANNRAEALACRAAMLQAEPVCTCPSGDGSLRWPCPVHPGNSPIIGIDLASGQDRTVEVRYVAPPGYVMVPKEPTAQMYDAGDRQMTTKQVWDAMLAAAQQEGK